MVRIVAITVDNGELLERKRLALHQEELQAMRVEAHRIKIDDPEDNFLYLNLAAPRTDVELLVAIINRASDGRARLEPPMSAEDQELTLEAIERRRRRVDR